MSLPVSGELLAGRYELGATLGVGGMAEVRRGWDTLLRRPVAIKLFHPSEDVDANRRIDNEARTLAQLSHPGLVSVYDAGDNGQTAFVVLRLVEGRTLRVRIADGPLSVAEVRSLGAQLADALAYVHERDVVHRDVKPSNILLDVAGTPYLADFGLAHMAGSTRFTRTDQVVGTAAYLSPEQVRGGDIGPATDVYSLGLVLLECLTGRREYQGGDIEAAVARLHRPPTVPDDLPADLVRLLSLMTSLSTRRRPTAEDCARVLRTGELPAFSDDDDDEPTLVAAARPRREWPKKPLAASAAGLLGAFGITWALLPGPTPATSAPVEPTQSVVQDAAGQGTTAQQETAQEATAREAAAQEAAAQDGTARGTASSPEGGNQAVKGADKPVVEQPQPAGPGVQPDPAPAKDDKGGAKAPGKAAKGKP
ncbi:protein kinase [Actinosynnema sp. NPDC023658]|uniref:serine/threonine-protein kinase n=1 Tax=Actinosynnema sp. NPDC023658 TaxID=3155465 RepID=UPI0033C25A07